LKNTLDAGKSLLTQCLEHKEGKRQVNLI